MRDSYDILASLAENPNMFKRSRNPKNIREKLPFIINSIRPANIGQLAEGCKTINKLVNTKTYKNLTYDTSNQLPQLETNKMNKKLEMNNLSNYVLHKPKIRRKLCPGIPLFNNNHKQPAAPSSKFKIINIHNTEIEESYKDTLVMSKIEEHFHKTQSESHSHQMIERNPELLLPKQLSNVSLTPRKIESSNQYLKKRNKIKQNIQPVLKLKRKNNFGFIKPNNSPLYYIDESGDHNNKLKFNELKVIEENVTVPVQTSSNKRKSASNYNLQGSSLKNGLKLWLCFS